MRREFLFKVKVTGFVLTACLTVCVLLRLNERMNDRTLDYFLSRGVIRRRDAAEVSWSHAVNSESRLSHALTGHTHMMEADVVLRGSAPREPITAHPPDTDSDITLGAWLQAAKPHNKGIKLDFKSLEAVAPSLLLLQEVLTDSSLPVWVNADVLPGPGGAALPLSPSSFLLSVSALPPHSVLSLGWTTGWSNGSENAGYSWPMVREMEQICRSLAQPVTFPVRAALLSRSFLQLQWLLQQSDRYGLTVWTGEHDPVDARDLLPYRKEFHMSRIYYDLPDSLRAELIQASPDNL